MTDRRYAQAVCRSLEGIDPELLYDAYSYRAPRLRRYSKQLIAAALIILIVGTAIVISSAMTVRSCFTLDSNFGVTFELNGGGKVVRARATSPLYEQAAKDCRGKSASAAAELMINKMSERGGLDSSHNTLLFGVTDDSSEAVERIIDGLDAEQYRIVRSDITDEAAIRKLASKYSITAGKAAYIKALNAVDSRLSPDMLYRLTASDLAVLEEDRGKECEGVTVSGTSSKTGYLLSAEALAVAQEHFENTVDRSEVFLDTNGEELVYYVILYYGDRGRISVVAAQGGAIIRSCDCDANEITQVIDGMRMAYRAEVSIPIGDPSVGNTPADVTSAPTVQPTGQAETAAPSDAPQETPTSAPTNTPTEAPTSLPTSAPTQTQEGIYIDGTGFWATKVYSSVKVPRILNDVSVSIPLSVAHPEDQDEYLTPQATLVLGAPEKDRLQKDHSSALRLAQPRLSSTAGVDTALLLVQYRQVYTNRDIYTVQPYRSGSTLYIAFYTNDRMYDDIPAAEPTVCERFFELDRSMAEGITAVKITNFRIDELIGTKLAFMLGEEKDLYFVDRFANSASTAGEAAKILEIGKTDYHSDAEVYADDWLAEDYQRYNSTAALIMTADAMQTYAREYFFDQRQVEMPEDDFFRDNAVVAFTNVIRLNIDDEGCSYTFIRKGATLCVCYQYDTYEVHPQYAGNLRVVGHFIGIPKEDIAGVRRIVPVNVQYRDGKYYPISTY